MTPSDLPLSASAPLAPATDGSSAEAHPFCTPEAARYSGAMLVGRGGMGRVSAVYDARLGREVARKDVPPGTPEAATLERRLAREAWITARLDHPGIVAVHDAGADPAGHPYFTMRLIRGRSLAAALDARDLDTAALLRHFLAVCHAMAHAHARRIVHRDLKPTNIMLGPFGETQVVDWGVARQLDAVEVVGADADPSDADGDRPTLSADQTTAGARIGTAAWMSPEQTRGDPVGTASDVYALGLVLRSILARDPAAAPMTEANAILARALATRPSERYPDAGALAADVAAWLDGKRVSALVYSPLDLARRFYRAFRAPLLVAATALVVIAVVVTLMFAATRRERDRALEAEDAASRALELATQSRERATLALAEAERTFADLLIQQAVEATLRGARPEAELLALHALSRRPSPVARGVLSRFAVREGPELRDLVPLPACEAQRLSPGGDALLCADALHLSVWSLAPDRTGLALRWQLPRPSDEVAWLTRDLLITDGVPRVIDAATSATFPLGQLFVVARVRPSLATSALMDTGEGLFAWTDDGPRSIPGAALREPRAISADGFHAITYDEARQRLGLIDVRTATTRDLDFDLAEDGPMSVALSPDGAEAAVATLSGTVHLIHLGSTSEPSPTDDRARTGPTSAALWSRSTGSRPIARLAFSPDGRWLAARDDRGFVTVLDRRSGDRQILPRLSVSDLAWRDDPTGPLLVTIGDALRTWSLPPSPRPHTLFATAGISALALSPSAPDPPMTPPLLALADGRGALSVFELGSGATVALLPGDGHAVAKDLTFLGDRPDIIAAIWPGRFRTGFWHFQGTTAPHPAVVPLPSDTNYRRIVATRSHLIAATYGQTLHDFPWTSDDAAPGAPLTELLTDGELLDLAASSDGTTTATLSSRGTIRVTRDRVPAADGLGAPGATALALAPRGHELAVITPASARCVDLASSQDSVQVQEPSSRLVAVAVAERCAWLAAGTIDGRVLVWNRAGALVLDGRAHTQRVSDLAFTADGMTLVSASWDGTAIVWSLEVVATPPRVLLDQLEVALGLGLDHALAADLR